MTSDMQVRVVTVEFLRPGPPHNHLLSPLTQYLAICNNSGAGVVTVPYEHAEFERRLRLLRYEAGEPEERRPVLHEIGQQMGNILGAVPGLPGALTVDPHQLGTMIQLRITLSASELAMLPFELAKVPAAEFNANDNRYSTAEGARFNAQLALINGSEVHNPFLVEALLLGSITQVERDYGVTPSGAVDLTPRLRAPARGTHP